MFTAILHFNNGRPVRVLLRVDNMDFADYFGEIQITHGDDKRTETFMRDDIALIEVVTAHIG